jgi:hypothetical protein
MVRETLRKKAIELADALLGDIESSVRRGVAVFGVGDFLNSVLPSFIGIGANTNIAPKIGETYTGERRDLKELLGCKDWVSTALAITVIARQGNGGLIKPGDYFRLPIKANAGSFGGLKFEALDIPETELVVVQTTLDGKIILNFEEILFFSAINNRPTNEGGFKESALCKYLNTQFLDALDPIRDILQKNKDGNLIALPTAHEVFGDNDDSDAVNWDDEPRQHEYFKKIKNRIKTKNNDAVWWWLSTPNAGNGARFCYVNSGGNADYNYASTTYGCSPCFCLS